MLFIFGLFSSLRFFSGWNLFLWFTGFKQRRRFQIFILQRYLGIKMERPVFACSSWGGSSIPWPRMGRSGFRKRMDEWNPFLSSLSAAFVSWSDFVWICLCYTHKKKTLISVLGLLCGVRTDGNRCVLHSQLTLHLLFHGSKDTLERELLLKKQRGRCASVSLTCPCSLVCSWAWNVFMALGFWGLTPPSGSFLTSAASLQGKKPQIQVKNLQNVNFYL